MKKSDVVEKIVHKYQTPIGSTTEWVDAVCDAMFDCLIDDNKLMLNDFGSFWKVKVKPTKYHLPNGVEGINEGRYTIKFKPSKRLGEILREQFEEREINGAK